jgi:ubiquinone/menaquinone biosynthesis C-methylase UbiE
MDILKKKLSEHSGGRILDVATGKGSFARRAAGNGQSLRTPRATERVAQQL